MDLNDPLPRLLRLHAMVVRITPGDDVTLSGPEAEGLAEAYIRLRDIAHKLAVDLEVDSDFDAELPAHQLPRIGPGPRGVLEMGVAANKAATLLKSLVGWVEGMVQAVALDQRITVEQLQAAREAARQPVGFR